MVPTLRVVTAFRMLRVPLTRRVSNGIPTPSVEMIINAAGAVVFGYWWLTQNTAVPTTSTMMKKMAQASTWLSDLAVLGWFLIASPLVGLMGDCR